MRKKLSLLTLLSASCFADTYIDIGIDNAQIHGGQTNTIPFNADVEVLNDNSWRFISNSNPKCLDDEIYLQSDGYGPTNWHCKRGDVWLKDESQYEGKTLKYTFDFTVEKYPKWPSPYFMIVLQDLLAKNGAITGDITEEKRHHPMSTLKLKNYNGILYLGHFDNSWQWNTSFDHKKPHPHTQNWNLGCWGEAPIPNDGIHHQENTCNGVYRIQRDTTYKVEFIIAPYRASLVVDGNVVTDVAYKTDTEGYLSDVKWGMYWDPNYNPHQIDSLRTIYRIENVKRLLLVP